MAVSAQREKADELILTNGSSMRVATSVRSGTLQFLHVSEFGKICAQCSGEGGGGGYRDPCRRRKVASSSSSPPQRAGKAHSMRWCRRRRRTTKARRISDPLEYRFHFAGWWEWQDIGVPRESVAITGAEHDYFNRIESEIGRAIDNDQRAWYISTRDNNFGGDWQLMKQEYPSTPDEAFEQSQEGVYYAAQLAAARRQGRITDVPYDPRCRSTRSGISARTTIPASGSTSTSTAGTISSTFTNVQRSTFQPLRADLAGERVSLWKALYSA